MSLRGFHRVLRIFVGLVWISAMHDSVHAQRGNPARDIIPAGSRVEYKKFASKILARDIPYGLYLPPSAKQSPNKKYPVLYFLHGANENEIRWSSRGETDLLLDRLIATKEIGEFVVAVPFGANSFYTNAKSGERWEDMLITEFLPMIESTTPAQATRRTRGISGISMGGFGSLKLAFRHPDLFGSVSAHSAALLPNLSATGVGNRRAQFFFGLFDRIFGLSQGLDYWNENNPLTLAENTAKLNGIRIYFDCGTEDDYGFYDGAKRLAEVLTQKKYPHEFHLYPGDHGWEYARQHTAQSLKFHWNAFNAGSR